MPEPLSAAERERILTLHHQGMSRNGIAAEVGRSPGAVSKVVHAAGLTFERAPEVEAATRAKQVDNREKRARLESLLLDDALQLREQLWQPCLVYNFGGKDNTYEERRLERPDFAGQRAIMLTVTTAIDRAIKLADVDKATTGADAGRSMVGDLFTALHRIAEGEPDEG